MNEATTPQPKLPGERKLTPKELSQQARAKSCLAQSPADTANCKQNIFIGMFFDGTNNNMLRDMPLGHSNIACLYNAHRINPSKGYFKYYIPGVGSPFPEIGEMTESQEGNAMAAGGAARLHYAMIQIYNAVHFSVFRHDLVSDKEARDSVNSYWQLKNVWTLSLAKQNIFFRGLEARLKKAIAGKKPEITQINLSVFGFSRGAAKARAFCHWMSECCDKGGGGYTFCGIPVRFQFLGIFDTVASVGVADSTPILGGSGADGFFEWADGTMQVHGAVERCVHFVAAHEIRKSFPLSTARDGNVYPSNTREVIYPGVHSDVGGGYAPGDHGKSPDGRKHLLSQLPLIEMLEEALRSGVPLFHPHQMLPAIQKDFEADESLLRSFYDYLNWMSQKRGKVEEVLFAHMRKYLRWRLQVSPSLKNLESYRAAFTQDRQDMEDAESDFQKDMRLARANVEHKKKFGRSDRLTRMQTAAVEEEISPPVPPYIHQFFDKYVHDSHAGFYIAGPVTTYNRKELVKAALEKKRKGQKLTDFEKRTLNALDQEDLIHYEVGGGRIPELVTMHQYDRSEFVKATREKAKAGTKLSDLETRVFDEVIDVFDFPTMTDKDVSDLRENGASGAVQWAMSPTRRESSGHVRERAVFDKS